MNKRYMQICLWLLIICILTTPLLFGCSKTSKTNNAQEDEKKTRAVPSKSAAKPSSTQPSQKTADQFSAAFKKLDKSPLNKDIEYMLWLTATEKDTSQSGGGQPSAAPLMGLADKFKKLVDSQGMHYTEVSEVMGMKLTTEYWLKNGKFKKVDLTMNEVTVCNGEYFVKYKADQKTGIRYKRSNPTVSPDINMLSYGMLPNLARSPYMQKEDQKFGNFDCSIFFMDIEVMGMKGNTLWVDKNTGMLVKNTYGDEKKGMVTQVSKFETGGFGDDVFTVPADIKLEDK